jgi:hypothetical protein
MLRTINTLLAFSFSVQLATVIAIVGFHNYSLGKVHVLNGVLFFILALTHITLNFGWIKKNIFGIK